MSLEDVAPAAAANKIGQTTGKTITREITTNEKENEVAGEGQNGAAQEDDSSATEADESLAIKRLPPAAKMQVRTSQVDQAELIRLVQVEAMELPDLGLVLSGMSGRFPKCESVNEFEENLRQGNDMINDQDDSRFTCGLWGLPPRAGRLKDLSCFDHEFFGFSQEEANYIDFQLRILYEVVYESILDAGVNPAEMRGTNTGVFFGLHCNEFENAMADDPAFRTNGYYAQFAIKVAQYFDFRGLTLTFDAACASGFVGLHNAVEALRDGTVDQAIVCSSNIPVHPTGSFIFYQMQMLSPTGYSRFLDSRADGYVKSEACVSLLLQRQHLARRNYASFMATMTSVDGYKPEGITFPSDKSQETLIRSTKELAGLSTNHVEYLEAHGTGTPAGDPQEARAISNVYYCHKDDGESREEHQEREEQGQERRLIGPLLVGSVKTIMGHSEAASGLCALVKVALMLENEIIYKNLHFDQPNTNIEALMDGRLKFVNETLRLRSRIIPLSCYGFGGSNVHVICRANKRESIPQLGGAGISEQHLLTTGGLPRLVLMFGRGERELGLFFEAILGNSQATRNCLTDDFISLLDSLSAGKIDRLMNYRGFCLLEARQRRQLERSIKRCDLKPLRDPLVASVDLGRRIHQQEVVVRRCHLAFSGLGCQWAGMATGLAKVKPFWATIKRLADFLEAYKSDDGLDLIGYYLQDPTSASSTGKATNKQSLCESFVAIVAYQIALVNLVRDTLGLKNVGAFVGHSLGEVSCAYASNLFDEREAIMVAFHLGRALDELKPFVQGKMVAIVGLDCHEVAKVVDLHKDVYASLRISCINGPNSVTISGYAPEVDEFLLIEMELYRQSMMLFEVSSEVALHNEYIMNQPEIRATLRRALERVLLPLTDYDRTKTEWISSFLNLANGRDAELAKQANVEYFIEMLCRPIDMNRTLSQLEPDSIIYELSPSNALESQIVQLRYTPPSTPATPGRKSSSSSSSSSLPMTRPLTTPTAMTMIGHRSGSRRASVDQTKRKFHYIKCMQRGLDADKQVIRLLSSFGELYQAGTTFNLANLYKAQTGAQVQFPVRRQTPSISSLFRWDRSASLFVPRYPIQFSKSSAKCEFPVDLVQDRDKYLAGHCIDGRVLYPATGYLLVVWRVFSFTKRKIYDACFQDLERELMPIEFRNVRLQRAIILGQRTSQLYVHFEEATGRFEVKEGGSVVVEGYAMSPEEKPDGLLHEEVRERLSEEQKQKQSGTTTGGDGQEFELSKDDIYKQFRVNGYDYGETFQCIDSCTFDGRMSRIRFNGHFVALTDSILQSIFLTITQQRGSSNNNLFLPTRFDYVRFQPEMILKRLREVGMSIDQCDGSLNTKTKREMMNKIMQRESGAAVEAEADKQQPEEAATDSGENEGQEGEEEQPQPECIFETYCDAQTGIIITDGIEMRGIKASPAPRRIDSNDVLLESYQFVRDFELPVQDERLTQFEKSVRPYASACDSMSLELLMRLFGLESSGQLNGILDQQGAKITPLEWQDIEAYKREHLECFIDPGAAVERTESSEDKDQDGSDVKEAGGKKDDYDIKKNGSRTLMSVMDQLIASKKHSGERLREMVQENRVHLLRDLLQGSFTSERFMRPLIETVLENSCTKKTKLRLLEINLDDGIMRQCLQQVIQQIEPSLTLDYALAHPNPARLHGSVTATTVAPATSDNGTPAPPPSSTNKTYTIKEDNIESLFSDHILKGLDFIVFKDWSCYRPTGTIGGQADKSDQSPRQIFASLGQALRPGGYCLVMMRRQMTLAERVMLALGEPETVGLDATGVKDFTRLAEKIELINPRLEERCNKLLEASEMESHRLHLVSRKSDQNGCSLMLFKRIGGPSEPLAGEPQVENLADAIGEQQPQKVVKLLLRVRHDQLDWLEELKESFKIPESKEEGAGDEASQDKGEHSVSEHGQQPQQEGEEQPVEQPKQVWLCAVATKQNPISGLIGMMQALRKELGSANLRCFYDVFTFARSDEPVSIDQIEASEQFQEALKRDQIWTCVDEQGQLGAFRHFTINDFLSNEECLCANQKTAAAVAVRAEPETNRVDRVWDGTELSRSGVYANNLIRGDLSSFAWFEAPFRYLTAEQRRENLIRVAYSALNFRDIMLATGRLPLDAIPVRLAMSDCLLGLEFSGYDGQGKRVMGMIQGRGIGSHVWCSPEMSMKIAIPDWLSLREAATIPVVYSTVIMALIYRGRIRRGESILIHAGSGGVGQAAIRLASHFGLEIYTTVGSQEKRQFLLDEFGPLGLSPERIFNSRTCEFEHQILAQTRGRGVDLVLNSLADDKLQASLNCLADGGRFLEIGKYDMSVDARLELFKLDVNKSFHGILVDKLFDVEEITEAFKTQLRLVRDTLEAGLHDGFIKPINSKLFKRNEIEKAFRFMATGKHVGKVLIEMDPSEPGKEDPLSSAVLSCAQLPKAVPRFQLPPEKSFIVTGGLGGFGLELCKWLVNQGARQLVLTSRTGLRTGYQRATLGRLEATMGVKISIIVEREADASQLDGARRLLRIAKELAPGGSVGGIFHLAMVLRDTLLENMTSEDFELVFRPKVAACLCLDEALDQMQMEVDYFVAFSSITSGKGNAGQANYAYANSCLERVCERRRARGQHGLAIQWGAIGDVGVAYENLGGNEVVIGGTIPQRMPSCLQTLARLLCSPFSTCLSVLPVNRNQDGLSERGDLVGAIMHVLGIKDPSKVSEDATLGDLGLDSLMAVEIRQYIEREHDITLNIQEIRALTIARIREISENSEKPAAGAAAAAATQTAANGQKNSPDADQKKQASSYGKQPQQAASVAKRTRHEPTGKATKATESAASADHAHQAHLPVLDKSMVSSFVPALELPGEDFCLLNDSTSFTVSNSPIFFLPPIHGQFDKLKPVCEKIRRPCVGLNWTRKLGQAQSVDEAVEIYLKLLEQTDWEAQISARTGTLGQRRPPPSEAREQTVDLVGYSFGAAIAFELMVAIERRQALYENRLERRLSNGSQRPAELRDLPVKGQRNILKAGRLVLLDGSPKQIELGSQYLAELTRKRPLKVEDKVDELLMVYIMANARSRGVEEQQAAGEYLALLRELKARSEFRAKVDFASERLANLLAASNRYSKAQQTELTTTTSTTTTTTTSTRTKVSKQRKQPPVTKQAIFHAMEAFLRRYELINSYKAKWKLANDCTLIRAEKLYLKQADEERAEVPMSSATGRSDSATNNKFNEDLDLTSVVAGRVDLYIMSGDHETFLSENELEIGRIIMDGSMAEVGQFNVPKAEPGA